MPAAKIRTHLTERMERLESNLQKAAEKGGPDFIAFREKVKGDRQRLKDKLSERKEAYSAFFADANDEERQARRCHRHRLCDRDGSAGEACCP